LDRLHDEKQTFDVIFMDPPYRIASDMAERVSKKIRDYGLLAKDGLFIVEHASEEALSHNVINLTFSRCCKYGATMLTFFIE
ncbi:MAG TPA: RsmD family RNA methyltransferase, partial [Bacillota bacterium]|nr:RsmD family RNA methyltransferase [Bacillota bacterium]